MGMPEFKPSSYVKADDVPYVYSISTSIYPSYCSNAAIWCSKEAELPIMESPTCHSENPDFVVVADIESPGARLLGSGNHHQSTNLLCHVDSPGISNHLTLTLFHVNITVAIGVSSFARPAGSI